MMCRAWQKIRLELPGEGKIKRTEKVGKIVSQGGRQLGGTQSSM